MQDPEVDVSLASSVESALARPWYVLRFGMPLERWYNEDTAQSRLRSVTLAVTVGGLFIMLFLVSDYALMPDVFIRAVILRGLVTSLVVTAGLFWVHRTKSVAARESVVVAVGLLTELISVYLLVKSRSPYCGSYLGSTFLIMLYVNIAGQPRFPYAVIATSGCLATVFASLILISGIPAPVGLWLAVVNITAGALTLVSNFQLERQARQHYLMTMQEQLRSEHLATNNFELKNLSEEDPLTGLYNRRALEHRFDDAFNLSRFRQTPISVLMIDVDHFKAYNDHFGHPMGDKCLKTIATILMDKARGGSDLVARYGGEEFIIVMPQTDRSGVLSVGERIRRAIEACAITAPPQRDMGSFQVVTASFGAATCEHAASGDAIACGCTPADLIRRADQCLYTAKASGRNRVSCG
jgi:diguanylate cyclase (GGDEF)-like protein